MANNFKNKFLTINRKKIEIVKFIGSGSLGGVWEIKNELGYPKALKVLYKIDSADTPKFLAKLEVLKKINHPNIMKIDKIALLGIHNLQSLLDDTKLASKNYEVPCFIMPYASINIADYIVLHKENLLERIKLALQFCAAVKKIHQLKVYNSEEQLENLRHNNIKFSNLLLVSKNNSYLLKISDLGIDMTLGTDGKFATPILQKPLDDYEQMQKILTELFSSKERQKIIKNLPELTEKTILIWSQALRKWEKKLRDEKRAFSHLRLGVELYEKNIYDYALRDLNKAISIHADLYDAHLFKGHVLRDSNQENQAKESYDQAIELNKGNPRAYEGRAEYYLQIDNVNAAIKDFEQAITLDPKQAFSYATLGSIYKEQKEYKKAIVAFSHLLELMDDCVLGYVDRGDVYFVLEEYENAKKDYEKALLLEKDNEEIKAKYALSIEKLKQ